MLPPVKSDSFQFSTLCIIFSAGLAQLEGEGRGGGIVPHRILSYWLISYITLSQPHDYVPPRPPSDFQILRRKCSAIEVKILISKVRLLCYAIVGIALKCALSR